MTLGAESEHALLPRLAARFREAWSPMTSASRDDWAPENPALGQCAVTALIVQDMLGGDMLRSTIGGVSHYWNRLPGGDELDLTREQFGPGAVPDAPYIIRTRGYVLSDPETRRRYRLLSKRMKAAA